MSQEWGVQADDGARGGWVGDRGSGWVGGGGRIRAGRVGGDRGDGQPSEGRRSARTTARVGAGNVMESFPLRALPGTSVKPTRFPAPAAVERPK